eukprot:6889194-Prymnesium_polylepis.1
MSERHACDTAEERSACGLQRGAGRADNTWGRGVALTDVRSFIACARLFATHDAVASWHRFFM